MIARPVHRPAPILFDAPGPQPGASQPRAISWAAASGPAEHPPLATQAKPFAPPHLSSIKKPLSPAPLAPLKPATLAAVPNAPRPARVEARIEANTDVGASKGSDNVGSKRAAPIKAPYDKAPNLTELSARYIGQGALSVRSSVTGRHYRFQGHGDSQKVDKNDLMLLKRIADLVIR